MDNLPTIDPVVLLPKLTRRAIRSAAQRPTAKAIRVRHTLEVLSAHKGNVSRTAHALGLHRRTLQRWLTRWALEAAP